MKYSHISDGWRSKSNLQQLLGRQNNFAASLISLFLIRLNFFFLFVKLELQGRTECFICRQHCEHSPSMLGYRGIAGCKIKLFLQGRKVLLNIHTGWVWVLRGAAIPWDMSLLSLQNSSRSITTHSAFILPFSHIPSPKKAELFTGGLVFLLKFYVQQHSPKLAWKCAWPAGKGLVGLLPDHGFRAAVGLITELKTFIHTEKLFLPHPASHKQVWPRSSAKRVGQQTAFCKQGVKLPAIWCSEAQDATLGSLNTFLKNLWRPYVHPGF